MIVLMDIWCGFTNHYTGVLFSQNSAYLSIRIFNFEGKRIREAVFQFSEVISHLTPHHVRVTNVYWILEKLSAHIVKTVIVQ
jgi:hypothetical protein